MSGHDPECESRTGFDHFDGEWYCANCGGKMTRPAWMDQPHEFRENGNDASMCLCGVPANEHDQWELGQLGLTQRGVAVVESGLTVRQAHEIQTGCTAHAPCANCLRYLT